MIYYIADCHFFHGALNEKMDKRGFSSVEEMNEYMVKKWNDKVTNTDTVIVVGDLSLGKSKETMEILDAIKKKRKRIEVIHIDREKAIDTSKKIVRSKPIRKKGDKK